MTPERFQLLEDLFHRALPLTPDQRTTFIDGQCTDDPELRAALKRLLAADENADPMAGAQEHIGRVVHATLRGAGDAPGDRIDRYVLKHPIGEGGFGVVFLAEQTTPVRRDVALKVIKLGMDTRQVIARFEAERQALAMMTHPGIAAVLDAGATPTGRPYFVMELVRGEPITDFSDRASLTIRRRLELFVQVCDAVQHAHQKGIIHRDLKPSNVLVAETGAAPLPKIIDFGIAKATGGQLEGATILTEARQFVGTPEYMSPEQTGAVADIDTRSDIYSLGVLLYELLTGATPFGGRLLRSASYAEMQRIIRETPPARPSSRVGPAPATNAAAAPDPTASLEDISRVRSTTAPALRRQLRGDLDWIILKCLAKERERRYHTAHDLALDIRRHLSSEPVVARPPSVRYRLQKFGRRHRVPLLAAAAVLVALIVGLAFATYGLFRARYQRNMAQMALTFIEDVIATPDPNRGNEAGITVVQALDLAARRLDEGNLKDSLEVEARVRRMLGSTYMALGLLEKAAPQLQRSLELAQRVYGSEAEQTAMAWNDLGELHRFAGAFDKASEAYAEARRVQRRLPPSMSAAQTLNNLGLVKQATGEFDEALELQRQALDMRIHLFGTEHPEVATSYNNLGALSMAMGDDSAAEDSYRLALQLRRRLLPPNHWRLANTQTNLARVLVGRGETVESDELATAALESARLAFGDKHTQVGRALFSLGLVRQAQGRYPEAEQLLTASVSTQRAALPAGHPEIAHSLSGLGELLLATARSREAEPILRESLELRQAKLGDHHPLVGIAMSLLGATYLGQGRLDEAEPLLIKGHEIIAAGKYVAPSQRRQAALRLADLAQARHDNDARQKWLAEANRVQ